MKRNADGLLENPLTGKYDIQRGRSGRFVSKNDEGRMIVGRVHRQHSYTYQGVCAQCKGTFFASKNTKKFCSTKCRVTAARDRKRSGEHGLSETHARKLRTLEKYAPKAAAEIKGVIVQRGSPTLGQWMIGIAFDVLLVHVNYLKQQQSEAAEKAKSSNPINRILGRK